MDKNIERLGPHARIPLQYWEQLPRREFVPDRRDFDPMAIVSILPLVTLLERVADDEWRFRLVGTQVEARWGGSYTGTNYLTLGFVSARAALAMRQEFGTVIAWPCGSWSRRHVEFRSGRRATIETLRLPLRANNKSKRIISCSEEFGRENRLSTDAPREIIEITEQLFLDIGAGAPTGSALA